MSSLNKERDYADKIELGKTLALMEGEIGLPPYYYNIHALCKMRHLLAVPKTDAVLDRLAKKGFIARRTHFSDVSIKTDAPIGEIIGVL